MSASELRIPRWTKLWPHIEGGASQEVASLRAQVSMLACKLTQHQLSAESKEAIWAQAEDALASAREFRQKAERDFDESEAGNKIAELGKKVEGLKGKLSRRNQQIFSAKKARQSARAEVMKLRSQLQVLQEPREPTAREVVLAVIKLIFPKAIIRPARK